MPVDAKGWLVLTLALNLLLWVPYVLNRFAKLGIPRTVGNPVPSDNDALAPWAKRAQRAHANAVEGLVVFGPLALLCIHSGLGGTALVTGACATYFVARFAHYVVYVAGVPVLRTLAFAAGFLAQFALIYALWSA